MARGMPRTSFNSSRLVRLLADFSVTEVAEAKQPFAERLGLWLDFTDAMALYSALHENVGNGATTPASANPAIEEEFARLRHALAESIATDGVLKTGNVRIKLPTPAAHLALETAADFSPYHRYYLAHQRDMAAGIGPLRGKARATLAGQSPPLRRLAALDAVMDEAMASRERNLLTMVPLLLAKRFEHLYKAHQAALGETPDDPAQWMQPDGWLAAYCRDMQAVLLAELDLRLEPVAGLIEALGNDATR
ncbi:MAG: DUF3348 domain-containing protein [Dechloromonas sp.]|nr:DUF3348 domain-containing protein [Dechloromonas sp.]